MADAFVFPCTQTPKRPFWKSRPNYSLEYAGGAYKQQVALDFESIPEYPHDKAQWMSSQTQFQLPMIVEPISPFSMSSALPFFKQASYKETKSVNEPESSGAGPSQSEQSHAPEGSHHPLGSARRHGAGSDDFLPLPVIPEASSSGRLSAAEPSGASGAIGGALRAEARAPNTQDGETSRSNSNILPVLMTGPDSSSTHSGLTSDSAPRTPPPIEKDYFGDAISRSQPEDYLAQPDGIDHEVYPAPPHSYISSDSTLYLRDSWGQFVLDAQSHYVSASGSIHGTELRSNKPPSTIEERGEKWTGEVPNVWSLFSQSPTSGLMDLPPSPVPSPPHNTLSVNPIFAHILWDVRFPPASASLIMPKFRNAAKYSSELWSDDEGSTRALARVEVLAPATYPPTPMLLISSSHTRWRARIEGEGAEGAPKAYVTVADVMFALHEQLSLRFVKQSEWDKLGERTQWYVGRAYGRNRLGDTSDAGSVSSGFSGSVGDGQSMNGSIWSEGSRMSGESIGCGPGAEWGPGIRRADVLRDRTMFAGLKFDPSYKRRAQGEEGMYHLVMNLRRHEPEVDATSLAS